MRKTNNLTTKMATYLGPKGYTLLKGELSDVQQQQIKTELTVKPYMPGAPVQVGSVYPVYRESSNKLYVPRYYGEEKFGPPGTKKISDGEDINLCFNGTLRDYQKPTIQKYLDHVLPNGGGGLLQLPCAWGKTDGAISMICTLGKKTLVIVHKEFLMDQWIERIRKYLPSARIGKIQGQIIDIDNKDIVLGMLQSLSMKDYPLTLFSSFGFTIIDEVHHISSEVFSCALFKLVTKYMLGLSATMDRKDGTTKVFKMFLGEVIDKQERSKDEPVVVRSIVYKTKDEEFNKVETDFRGNTAIAKMISKLCEYNRRSEFILDVLTNMFAENPSQQIMMISQYKSILKYMFDAINHKKIATVGYYIGGMKQAALKQSESNQVVLATYTMASEGLDIKSLTTLFMITPMTNVEQPVGRILRQRHGFDAVVVDIVDNHSNFQNQWTKRKRFYKSQNYKIIQTNSDSYVPETSSWKVLYNPTGIIKTELEENCDDDEPPAPNKCMLSFPHK